MRILGPYVALLLITGVIFLWPPLSGIADALMVTALVGFSALLALGSVLWLGIAARGLSGRESDEEQP